MNTRTGITYNVTGQTIPFYAPQWALGAPAGNASFSVFAARKSNDDTAEFSGTATLDTVSTTVDASSGYAQTDRRKINLTSTTGIQTDRFYVLANGDGQRELIKPRRIVTNDYIENEQELAFDYSTTATFKGLLQTAAVDATFVATESKINSPAEPYRVKWTYTIGGVSYIHWTEFDLVRQKAQHSVSFADLVELWPDLGAEEWADQRGSRFAKQIDAAFERVQFEAKMNGIEVWQLRDGQYLDEIIRLCAVMLIAETGLSSGRRDQEQFVAERQKAYKDAFTGAITVLKLAIDRGREGSVTGSPGQLFFRR